MDTDSPYFSLPETSLEASIPTDRRSFYEALKKHFVVTDDGSVRTTGQVKLEWSGRVMICLSAKTYIAFSWRTEENGTLKIFDVKLSTKGVSKVTNDISAGYVFFHAWCLIILN